VIYLSGCSSPSYEQAIIDMGVGLLIQPGSYAPRRVEPFPWWAADNGCYPPDPEWSAGRWIKMLGGIMDLDPGVKDKCLYLLVPDMPFDHFETLVRWYHCRPWAALTGLPLAFAAQDGCTVDSIPWNTLDVIFLAGTTEWKVGRGAFDVACQARERGKWVHMGRVNSWERLDLASAYGCDSSDGTFMKHGKPEDMVARIKVWLDNNSPRLFQKQAAVS
jgi:hypothetical protein